MDVNELPQQPQPTHAEIKGLVVPVNVLNGLTQIATANGVQLGVVINAALMAYLAGKQVEGQIIEANRASIVIPRPNLRINNGTQ